MALCSASESTGAGVVTAIFSALLPQVSNCLFPHQISSPTARHISSPSANRGPCYMNFSILKDPLLRHATIAKRLS